MGSKKKKADKKKDFVKPKLKVGKTAAKPDNYTDTSFIAKTISLPNQSIAKGTTTTSTSGGSSSKSQIDLTHHLSLTKHHSNTTRKEVLIYIENHLPDNPSSYSQILTTIVPLILDESQSVRTQLIQLLKTIAEKQPGLLDLHFRSILLFILSAMTHIQPGIRNSSSKFLNILIDNCINSLVVGSYYIKILTSYFQLMGWNLIDSKKQVSLAITTTSIEGSNKRARIGHLQVLHNLLTKSLAEEDTETQQMFSIHPQTSKYLIPQTPNPYASLKLFVYEVQKFRLGEDVYTVDDLDSISTEDLSTRRKIINDVFKEPMVKHLGNLIKEGGEVGREANNCMLVLNSER
ncbi:Pre-rRNA-processing protein IPI1 [Spathaspora sp. JA1]|nr:Pre-rRNA-processing protein IPI1 [Spathaspora sp. JA1]